jgi:hypothetical protein
MPKYLIEIILVVEAKNPQGARNIADYILNLPIQDQKIENAIETMRYEEIVQIKNKRQILAKTMHTYYKGLTATKKELREGGYFHTAKLIILRELWQKKKGSPPTEKEETIKENSILPFENQKPQNNKRKGMVET